MSDLDRLKKEFLNRAVKIGEFTLSSGKNSSFYLNCKNVLFRSELLSLIGRLIYINTVNLEFDSIGGTETGAIPITSAVLMTYEQSGKQLRGFYVRKIPKDHGNKSMIEGSFSHGDAVVIVEDVTTTGKSTLRAVE